MIILTTSKCHLFGHPEFIAQLNDSQILAMDAQPILQYLEEQVSHGVKFLEGQTFQIGWMVVKFKLTERGLLGLNEPDMSEIPIRFVNSLSNTIHHLRLQKDVAESIGVEPRFPTILQSALKCSRYDDNSEFFMDRADPVQNDSGWFFGCTNPHHDHNDPSTLLRVSLYELACSRDSIIPFVALPPGFLVKAGGTSIQISQRGIPCELKPGSFLDLKLRKGRGEGSLGDNL
jgi:hypothetical protein